MYIKIQVKYILITLIASFSKNYVTVIFFFFLLVLFFLTNFIVTRRRRERRFLYYTLQKRGAFVWDIWTPFGKQGKLLKIIILDILCINGIKVLKTDNRFLETALSAALWIRGTVYPFLFSFLLLDRGACRAAVHGVTELHVTEVT